MELMLAAEQTARGGGFHAIGLETGGETNQHYRAARRLYKRLGYVEVVSGPWINGWSSRNDEGKRESSWEILESYFLKDLTVEACLPFTSIGSLGSRWYRSHRRACTRSVTWIEPLG